MATLKSYQTRLKGNTIVHPVRRTGSSGKKWRVEKSEKKIFFPRLPDSPALRLRNAPIALYAIRLQNALAHGLIGVSLFVLLMGLNAVPVQAQSASLRGFVTAAADGEVLQGVNVTLDNLSGRLKGAASNGDGFFLIARVSPGRYQLRASFIGFAPYVDTLDIEADDRLLVNIVLRDDALEMDAISVEAERESGAAHVTAGQQTAQPRDIALVPSPDVSGDLVSYLSTIPSVVLMGDRGGQVFIRGGEPTQNLTLLDGIEIYQPFHVLGFYSAFSSAIISRADIYAGGFGSTFSGRISSVIDVHSRNGNKRGFSASAAMSSFTSAGHIEGPLLKDHLSFLGAARYSMLDQFATRYVDTPLPYVFDDLFGKVHARLGKNQQVSVTALKTFDRGTLTPSDDFFQRSDEVSWRNTAVGIRYLVAPRTLPILGEVLVSFSRLESTFGPRDAPIRTSDLDLVNVAINMTNFGQRTQVNWGFFLRAPTTESALGGLFQGLTFRRSAPSNAGAYLEPEVYLGGGLYARPGVILQTMGLAGDYIEPRLRLRLERGIHHWSAAAGIYRQMTVGLSDRRDATNIFTAWVQTPSNEAMRSMHTLIGYRVEPFPWLEFSLEGFYKNMDHLFIGEWTAFPSFTTRLQEAHGDTYGFDLRLEIRRPWFYGFINYGLSSTRYEIDPESPAVVNPGRFRPPHDRRHQINLLASTTLFGFDLSARWQFGSGLPYTRVEGFDGFLLMNGAVDVRDTRGFPRVIYESIPYQAVLPAYHRLDVTVGRTFALVLGTKMTVQAGLLNAYDRANLFSLDLLTAQRSDQLPVVPIVGLKVDF